MWLEIQNIFEKLTLLNKLSARCKFYTANKSDTESILEFSNRIQHMSSNLKSMNVTIDDTEMAMTLLCGLPDTYDTLISASDDIGREETVLEFYYVKIRVMQEEKRINMSTAATSAKSETRALISNCQAKCENCHVSPGMNTVRQNGTRLRKNWEEIFTSKSTLENQNTGDTFGIHSKSMG